MARKLKLSIDAQDWRSRLQEHPLEIEGALIRFRSKAALLGDPNELSLTLAQWARMWGVDEKRASELLAYIISEGLAESDCATPVTVSCNDRVTLAVHFASAEEKVVVEEKAEAAREKTRLRVQKHREAKRMEESKRVGVTPPPDPGAAPLLAAGGVS